jgi:katanin p60 ATPase-containing subunit A1
MPSHPYSAALNREARSLANAAKEKETQGDLAGAAQDLKKAAGLLLVLAESATALDDEIRLTQKAKRYKEAAARLERGERVATKGMPAHANPLPAEDEYRASVDELVYRANVTWNDIGGMKEAKGTLKYILGTMLAKHPEDIKVEIGRRILLYGPPGTGKTLLAAACSHMLGATFFSVKASDLMSKYFGESTKLVSALFKRAREEAAGGAALIFIDEVDSLSLSRSDGASSGTEMRIISTLLAELDGMAEKGTPGSVITIAATNKPWLMDEAIRQRFEKNIYVPLPDELARTAIFKVQLENNGFQLDASISHAALARRTEDYSGRLIRSVCQEAVERMLKEMNGQVPAMVDEKTITDYTLRTRPLNLADFDHALKRIRPTSNEKSLREYQQWAAQVGGEQA